MLACVYVVAFVGGITAGLVAAHTAIHSFSSLQAFLVSGSKCRTQVHSVIPRICSSANFDFLAGLQALFEVVNLMICLWEIALFSYAGKVANEYREFREK